MKKLIISAALGLMVPLMSFGQSTLGPGVMGTSLTVPNMPHNFSSDSWNAYNYTTTLGQQICQPCHTPHNAIAAEEAPLWNHQFSTAAYTFYTSIKDGTTMGVSAIDGTSKLCLACHDGTVALGSFGGQVGTNFLTGGADMGTDLSNQLIMQHHWQVVTVDCNLLLISILLLILLLLLTLLEQKLFPLC